MGMASLGLAGLMASQGLLLAADAAVSPLAPKAPPLPAKAKRVIHLFMNGGPSHVDTFDPKPMLAQVRRQAAAARQPPHRAQDRRRLPVAVQVPEIRTKRHRSQRNLPARRRVHRRHRGHPLDARRRAQPRAVAAPDELRRGPADPAEHGVVGDVRPGQREPEPARLHRHVPRRLPDPGDAELAGRLPARRLPGHLHRHAAYGDRQTHRKRQGRLHVAAGAAAAARPACGRSTSGTSGAATATRRWRRASSRSSWPTGCRWRPATPST